MNALLNWLDHRTGIKDLVHEALYERVPGGARWRYVWGSTLVFTFVLQVITGLMLWTAYSPSTRTAWESVNYIQHEMYLGNIIRGLHHYCAQAMVVLLAIHLIQVIIDGAYKAPREVNFWLGLVLAQIVLGLSLTGYLLPWDQKGYYATQVTTNIMSAAPVIGPEIQQLAQGGKEYGHLTLTRFFAMHAGILPGLLVMFLGLHIYVFRRHGLTTPPNPDPKKDTMFWPDQVLRDAVACLAVLAVVLLMALFRPAELSAPADTATKFDAARPEWYFLFLFRFLRFKAVDELGVTFGAIIVPGLIMGVIAAMPFIHRFLGRAGHRFNVGFIGVLTVGVIALTTMAIIEDNSDPSHQAAIADAERDADRVQELINGPARIPVSGAISLMRDDPLTQGPRLFATHCAACHRYDGHDGRGNLVMETVESGEDPVIARPTAADLKGFAKREWMRSIITDYSNHFRWLKNANWYKEGIAAEEDVLNPDDSEMVDWSGYADVLNSDEGAEPVSAIVEYLVQQAAHSDTEVDADLAAAGRKMAVDGEWPEILDGASSCADCHSTIGGEFEAIDDELADGYPTLAEYGSQKWLRDFIRHPDANRHYGPLNQMPAYGPGQLPDQDLDLLVRWLTGDYQESELPEYPSRLDELE